ncbi:MAG: hypothetical protein JSS51_03515 [Planctomycetes bacterium]|nr:hypothetical protein [Planctomycetota bacterium]
MRSIVEKLGAPMMVAAVTLAAGFLVMLCVVLGGCSQPPLERSEPPIVAKQADDVKAKAVDVINRTEKIDRAADTAAKVPGAEQPAATIKAENKEIRTDAHAIAASAVTIRDSQSRIDQLAKERDAAIARAEKAESEAGKAERRIWVGVRLIAGIVGLVAIGLVLWGNGWAALFAVCAACVFFGSFAISTSIEHQTLIGGLCLAGVAVAAVIAVRSRFKSAREIADTVNLTVRNGKMPAAIAKVGNKLQSKTTKRLIDATQGNGIVTKARKVLAALIEPKAA